MRLIPFVLLLGLVVIGCNANPAQQIVGHWSVDLPGTELPKIPFPGAEEQIKTILSTIDVKFHADGTAEFSSGITVGGRWRFDGTSVIIVPQKPAQLQKLPLDFKELRFQVEPDLEHMTLYWATPVGEAKIAFVKSG